MSKVEKKKRTKSSVWQYFNKIDSSTARCKLCTQSLKHGGNTTNLMQHYKRKHNPNEPIGETIQSTSQQNSTDRMDLSDSDNPIEGTSSRNCRTAVTGVDNDPILNLNQRGSTVTQRPIVTKKPKKDTRIDETFRKMNSYKEGGEMSIQLTNSIMYMIAVDNLPLSTVEHKGFRQFCKKAVPLYTPPSRKTITRLLDERYEALKKVYQNRFQRIQNVTVTTDIWTDVSMKSYIGVTVHYLNDELKFINSTIGVIPLEQNHTADYIGCSLMKLCHEWEINVDQITAVVTDNASSMVKAINDTYGRKKHLRCFAHTLSLVYPEALKATCHLVELVSKIESIVTLTKTSVVVADELRRLQMLEGKTEGTALKLIQEVPTRWNSAFHMIERFLELKHHMHGVLLKCPTAPNMISRDELKVLTEIVEILQPIEYVTKTIGGDSYPTTSLVIPMTHCMIITVSNCRPVTPVGISFRENILKEFTKRFQHVESVVLLAIATLLDPRFKKIHFESPIALSSTMKHINNMIQANSQNYNDEIVQPTTRVMDSDDQAHFWNIHDSIVASKSTANDDGNEHDIELKQFLAQPVIPRTSDPIEYWKVTKHAYPKLYPIAVQYLSVVATSVPSERLFSKAGLIKNDLRNRITGKRLSALLFLSSVGEKDWNL